MTVWNGVGGVGVVLGDGALGSMIRRHEHDTKSIALWWEDGVGRRRDRVNLG